MLDRSLLIEGGLLAPMRSVHTSSVVGWRNDANNSKYFLTKHTFTEEGHEAWLQAARESGVDFNWVIEDSEGRAVGTIGLYNIDWRLRRGEIGRVLVGRRDLRRTGLARKAMVAVLQAAGSEGLEEVELCVIGENVAAYSLYLSLGFSVKKTEMGNTYMSFRP